MLSRESFLFEKKEKNLFVFEIFGDKILGEVIRDAKFLYELNNGVLKSHNKSSIYK